MSSVSSLYDFAAELLAESAQALATTAAGAPDRVYVAASLPALDCCPQLTVHVQGLSLEGTVPVSPGPVVGHRTQFGQLNLVSLVVTIVRCSPQPSGGDLRPPDIADLQALSLTVSEDLWAIWNRLTNLVHAGELFEGFCMAVYLDNPTPVDDSGGCAGWVIPVRAAIQGYTP